MAEPAYVFDATADNFRTLVLANSDKGPVAVNFWSPRAGPCLMLMPRLLKLAEEFRGRFLLVRLNTDEFGRLARDQGVTSIPTTKLFRHGAVVDTLHGAESEPSLRTFLRKHLRQGEAKGRGRRSTSGERRGSSQGETRQEAGGGCRQKRGPPACDPGAGVVHSAGARQGRGSVLVRIVPPRLPARRVI